MFNLTIAQFQPELGNKRKNLEEMKRMMKEAKRQNSQVILFPELCLTGYFIGDQLHEIAETLEGESIQELQKACEELGLHAVVSFPERNENGGVHISAALLDDTGKMIGVYRKTHLFDSEKTIFERGNEFPVFETKLGRMGIMICYDLEFPEISRILRLNNAQVILAPTANMSPYQDYQMTYMKSRAMENEVPIALANRIGMEEGTHFFGESTVVDAHGNVLMKMGEESELETVTIKLETGLDSKLNYVGNRQPSLYYKLTTHGGLHDK